MTRIVLALVMTGGLLAISETADAQTAAPASKTGDGKADDGKPGDIDVADGLLDDLGGVPVLARGYSLATNTLQGICLVGYDFVPGDTKINYRVEQLEVDGTRKLIGEGTGPPPASAVTPPPPKAPPANPAATANPAANPPATSRHSIVVTVDVETAYEVKPGPVKLVEGARALLTDGNLPMFFDSCGSYYVRAAKRSAQFTSVFAYQTSAGRDVVFETELTTLVKGGSGTTSADRLNKFDVESSRRRLTISSNAFGVAKDGAQMVAYDVAAFQTAIQRMIAAMQSQDAGRLLSMKISPWVQVEDVQAALDLGAGKPGYEGKEIPANVRKANLTLNAEFLAKIDKAQRTMLNEYYRTAVCMQAMLQFKIGPTLRPEFATRSVVNHKTGAQLPLFELDKATHPSVVEKLFNDYQMFSFNGADGKGGAMVCVRSLLDKDFTIVKYTEVPSCTGLEKRLTVPTSKIVAEHCLPQLAPWVAPAQPPAQAAP